MTNTTTTLVVYGTPWCADCKRSRAFLDANQVEYRYIDISENEEAATHVEKINGGYRSVPTIHFPDGTTLTEPSNSELESSLQANNLLPV